MFTGIIEEVGRIVRIDQQGENRRIHIEAAAVTKELKTGDSCAVSGVCLTALDITPTSFCADLAPETWVRTSFSRITPGARVNLELPLAAHGRLGGHIVQGHVDGVGRLEAMEPIEGGDGYWLHIQIPAEIEKYLVYKGSIAIEGISLTVAKLEGLRCSVAIIPHTVERTNLGTLKPGDPINLEADIVAKYLEKWMMPGRAGHLSPVGSSAELVAKGF
jgi:riboflavin synthase